MKKELLQKAHDALEGFEQNGRTDKTLSQGDAAIVALRAAIAQPMPDTSVKHVHYAPVAWIDNKLYQDMRVPGFNSAHGVVLTKESGGDDVAFYTTPQPADEWHKAVLHECMMIESCYVEANPVQTVKSLIDWHVLNERDPSATSAKPEGDAKDAEIAMLRNRLMEARHYVSDNRLYWNEFDSKKRDETRQEFEDRISTAIQNNEDRQGVLSCIDAAIASQKATP